MAITSQTATQIGPNTWIITVTSGLGSPTFYWYQDGILVETSERADRVFDVFDARRWPLNRHERAWEPVDQSTHPVLPPWDE